MRRFLVLLVVFAVVASSLSAEESCHSKSSTYVKLGAELDGGESGVTVIGGVGRRSLFGVWALDLSAQWGEDYFTAPRIQGLRYFPTCRGPAPYIGGGLSYGKVASFRGLMLEGTLGTELAIRANWMLFAELGVSQPLLSSRTGGIGTRVPAVHLSLGAGF